MWTELRSAWKVNTTVSQARPLPLAPLDHTALERHHGTILCRPAAPPWPRGTSLRRPSSPPRPRGTETRRGTSVPSCCFEPSRDSLAPGVAPGPPDGGDAAPPSPLPLPASQACGCSTAPWSLPLVPARVPFLSLLEFHSQGPLPPPLTPPLCIWDVLPCSTPSVVCHRPRGLIQSLGVNFHAYRDGL